jgi:hypothetical protein
MTFWGKGVYSAKMLQNCRLTGNFHETIPEKITPRGTPEFSIPLDTEATDIIASFSNLFPMLHLLGIRHHGPGSSKALLKALHANPPGCLLIEAPADAENLLEYFSNSQFRIPNSEFAPPVAMLIYNPADFSQVSYLPFADFSPEWQAMLFAKERGIPMRFIDLPMSLGFAFEAAGKDNPQASLDFLEKLSPEEQQFQMDPMWHLARLAGYEDSERWWEVTFESVENQDDIFAALLEMVTALRADAPAEKPETLRREAHMRQGIRQAVKEGFENIAVVCGAWHLPALHQHERFKATADAALLKGVKKVKTSATWIPWSYERLTFLSGYCSGVISPAWYELLFAKPAEATTRWMVNAAHLFRQEDVDASAAHVIEAVRLAETLATLRGLAQPGIGELREAAISATCEGNLQKLDLIEKKLVTGTAVGRVPAEIPAVPLQRDLEAAIKSARLSKYWGDEEEKWLGATTAQPLGGIDLREESGKLKSHLLHRLLLLGIPWGALVEMRRHHTAGGFKEFWKMQWSPEFAIRIIEMGAWGNTVESACEAFVRHKTAEITALPDLTALLEHTLNANLPGAFDALLQCLQSLSALTTDVYLLMDALPSLAKIVRYGNTRGTDVAAVEQQVRELVPRICIALPAACSSLDEDATSNAFQRLLSVNRALGLLDNPQHSRHWHLCLETIALRPSVNGILTGACTRILFDKDIFDTPDTATHMRYALSPGNAPLAAAQWLEGFLHGSGLVLLHHLPLWNLLDEWVGELPEDAFTDVLPLLRRTFSRFPAPERERMLDLAKQGQVVTSHHATLAGFDEERAATVADTVKMLMGIA